jgi:uncharacterized membrane protein YsdA (DUF1294 family)
MSGCIQSVLLFEATGIWLLLAGVAGFIAMGTDKARAVRREWRIPEATLFVMALAGGAIGMAIGSEVFRHKTSKLSFLAVLYSMVVLWILVLNQIGFLGCLSTYIPH